MRGWHRTGLLYGGQPLFVNVTTMELAVEDHGEHLVPLHPCPGCGQVACGQELRIQSVLSRMLGAGIEAHAICERTVRSFVQAGR